jgi:hypothetical protein
VPISYANIYIKDRNIGCSSNEMGVYSLLVREPRITDTIIISCLGYKSLEMTLDMLDTALQNKIILEPALNILEEVKIESKKIKIAHIENNAKPHSFFNKPMRPDYIETVFVPNKKNYRGYLKNLKVFVCKEGQATLPFRLHIYSKSLITNAPDKELITSNLIIRPNVSDDWLTIDLDSLNILIPLDGFFIGIEALEPHSLSSISLDELQKLNKKERLALMSKTNGACLQLGAEYWKSSRRKDFEAWQLYKYGKWRYLDGMFNTIAIKVEIQYWSKKLERNVVEEDTPYEFRKLSKRRAKRTIDTNIAYDDSLYPHNSIRAFFESHIKAVNNNSLEYLFTYLYVYNKENKQDYINKLKDLNISDKERERAISFFTQMLADIDNKKLVYVGDNIYRLYIDENNYMLMVRKKGKWYGYPYCIKDEKSESIY